MRNSLAAAALLSAILLCAPACAPASDGAHDDADSGRDVVIPDEAFQRQNPVPAGQDSLAAGERTFSLLCTPCHGQDARGSGDLAASLNLVVPDFTDGKWQAQRTDGELFHVLTGGHGAMPGQEDRLSEKLKWDVINHIRTLDD